MDGQKQKKSHMEHLFFFFYLNMKIEVARACSSISHTQWNKLWLSVPVYYQQQARWDPSRASSPAPEALLRRSHAGASWRCVRKRAPCGGHWCLQLNHHNSMKQCLRHIPLSPLNWWVTGVASRGAPCSVIRGGKGVWTAAEMPPRSSL